MKTKENSMKFTLIMKDPDGVSNSFLEAVKATMTEEELEDTDILVDKLNEEQDKMKKFIGYDEYIKIEVDTDKQTMTVIPWK